MVSVVSRLERPHSAKNERSRAQINGQAGRNPLSEALKCFGFNARGKRYCQPRLDYIGLASSGRRCLIRTSMIRKHFTGARIPRRRNAYVGKPNQNNLPICLLTRGCTCVCKKHTGSNWAGARLNKLQQQTNGTHPTPSRHVVSPVFKSNRETLTYWKSRCLPPVLPTYHRFRPQRIVQDRPSPGHPLLRRAKLGWQS